MPEDLSLARARRVAALGADNKMGEAVAQTEEWTQGSGEYGSFTAPARFTSRERERSRPRSFAFRFAFMLLETIFRHSRGCHVPLLANASPASSSSPPSTLAPITKKLAIKLHTITSRTQRPPYMTLCACPGSSSRNDDDEANANTHRHRKWFARSTLTASELSCSLKCHSTGPSHSFCLLSSRVHTFASWSTHNPRMRCNHLLSNKNRRFSLFRIMAVDSPPYILSIYPTSSCIASNLPFLSAVHIHIHLPLCTIYCSISTLYWLMYIFILLKSDITIMFSSLSFSSGDKTRITFARFRIAALKF